jgi:predicted acylesterase/phospholipase RssA
MASASVPPFMPVGRIGGLAALDGGLVDNVPVEPLLPVEARGGKTLVILSRLYRAVPSVKGRTYVQPSRPVPVGQFDITNPAGIRQAYEMGLKDGEAFAKGVAAHSF